MATSDEGTAVGQLSVRVEPAATDALRNAVPQPAHADRVLDLTVPQTQRPVDVGDVARTVLLGGCVAHLTDARGAHRIVEDRLARGAGAGCLLVASANVDHVVHFAGTPQLFDGGGRAQWLVLVDGTPLVLAGWALTGVRYPRLAGSDLLPEYLAIARRLSMRVGFLGGTPETVRALRAVVAREHPGLVVAGAWTPARDELAEPARCRELVAQVRAADVDLLVVSLGKPRQEQWMAAYGADTGASVVLGFGAATDFLAGQVSRAPLWMRHWGLEWAYRLYQEPRRLWRRYLVQGPTGLARLATRSRS